MGFQAQLQWFIKHTFPTAHKWQSSSFHLTLFTRKCVIRSLRDAKMSASCMGACVSFCSHIFFHLISPRFLLLFFPSDSGLTLAAQIQNCYTYTTLFTDHALSWFDHVSLLVATAEFLNLLYQTLYQCKHQPRLLHTAIESRELESSSAHSQINLILANL